MDYHSLLKKTILSVLALFALQLLFAQNKGRKQEIMTAIHSIIDLADSCSRACDYDRTISLCEEALTLIKKPKRYQKEYEILRYLQAESLIKKKSYVEGISILKGFEGKKLSIIRNGSLMGLLGQAFFYYGDISSAIYYLEQAEELYPLETGYDDYYWRGIELRLALAYARSNRSDRASEKINDIVDDAKERMTEDDYIGILLYLNDNFIKGENGQVVWHDKVGLKIVQELVDYTEKRKDWEWYVVFQGEIASIYLVLGDFPNAYTHYTDAIAHYQDSFSYQLSILYSGAAAAASRMNSFELAFDYLEKAEMVAKTELDEEWQETQRKSLLFNRASIYLNQGVKTGDAISIIQDLIANDNQNPAQLATYYYNLGQAFEFIHRYDEAYNSYRSALGFYEKEEGHGILYAKTLNLIGYSTLRKGELIAASEYFDLSLDIFRRLSGRNNYSYILALSNAAQCAMSMREYGRALAFAEESRELQFQIGSVFNPEIWDILLNCYGFLHDEVNHEIVYNEIKGLLKDDAFSQIKFALIDAQDLYYAGDVEEGYQLYKKACNLYDVFPEGDKKEYLREYVYDRGMLFNPGEGLLFDFYSQLLAKETVMSTGEKWSIGRLANDLANANDYISANTFFHLSYPVWIDNEDFLYNSYLTAYNCRDINFCTLISQQIEEYIIQQMKSVIGLSDNEKELYWSRILDFKNLLFSRINDESDLGLLCNIAIGCKSFLLRSNIVLSNLISESGDKSAIEDADQLRKIRQELNNRTISTPLEMIDSLRLREIELNRSIVSRIKNYSASSLLSPKKNQDVMEALSSNDVAIEIDDYPIASGDRQYIAFIIDKMSSTPNLVYLCRDSELKGLASIEPKKLYDKDLPFSLQLYSLILEKLMPFLTGKDNVYISTSGRISTIAIEAIACPDGKYFFEAYTVKRLTSTAVICDNKDRRTISSASVFGGIRYDNNGMDSEGPLSLHSEMPDYLQDRSVSETIDYLPGTKKETTIVSKILTDQRVMTHAFYGYEATEEAFKSLSGSNNSIIHVATHGFYKPVEKTRRIGFFQGVDNSMGVPPMRRSGLLMAGCNDAWNGVIKPGGEDGVLTASEISELDLSQTQLVVMSACETGLGEITEDGIAGLQRAFKNAGVEIMVMSLWKVDDKATATLMTEFYTQLAKGIPIRDAFGVAKNIIRQNKHYSNPYYWASFILLD